MCSRNSFGKILFTFLTHRFIVKDRCTSYTSAQRSLIVMQILLRAKFDDTEKVGVVIFELFIDRFTKRVAGFRFCVFVSRVEFVGSSMKARLQHIFRCTRADTTSLTPRASTSIGGYIHMFMLITLFSFDIVK